MLLNDFINKTRGKYNDVPWAKKQTNLYKECVSLVQCYLKEVLGQPAKARGNAKDWTKTYVNEGLGKIVSKGKYGDIVVFNKGKYGHIAIFIDNNTIYDQYNGAKANYRKMGKNPIFIRPNVTVEPYFVKGKYKPKYEKCVRLSPKVSTNRIKTKDLMSSVQDICVTDKNGYAKTRIGSTWEFVSFVFDSNFNIWAKRKGINTDLYVCVQDSTGNQVTKV